MSIHKNEEALKTLSKLSKKFEVLALVITVLSGVSFQFLSSLVLSSNELADLGYLMYIPIVISITLWILYYFIEVLMLKIIFMYNAWVCIVLAFFINNITFERFLNYKFTAFYFNVINWVGFGIVSIYLFSKIHKDIMKIIDSSIIDPRYKTLVFITGLIIFAIITLGSLY